MTYQNKKYKGLVLIKGQVIIMKILLWLILFYGISINIECSTSILYAKPALF